MFPINFLRQAATVTPQAIAVIDGESRCSYQELVQRCDALSVGIQNLSGLKRPVVAILGPNSIDMLVALMAIHASGSIIVPLNGRNSATELNSQIERVKPNLFIVHHDYLEKINTGDTPVIIAGGQANSPASMQVIEAAHEGKKVTLDAKLDEINAIKFTGGSSGIPKGVMQSFRSMNTLVTSNLLAFDFKASDRYLCAAPMTHGAGALLLPILARGGCVVLSANVSPDYLLEIIEKYQVTTTWVPPTMLYRLIDEQKARPRKVDSLTHLIWGGAPASLTRLKEAQAVFGPVVETVFGQTEAPLILSVARAYELTNDQRLTSVGRVGPLVDLSIQDENGAILGPNEMGEICARSDLLMTGYYKMPEETAKTLKDGWLHTGDVGMLDEDGFLYIKDRIRDVIISGGFNVYPSDVEAVLSQHPSVSEVVVFGVPDDYWGERVEAALELRSGMLLQEEELISFCKEQIGSVKTPKKIRVVNTLPRSPVGKVLRREAREQAISAKQ